MVDGTARARRRGSGHIQGHRTDADALLDDPIRRLSNAANNSRLWLGIAAALAVLGEARS